MTKQIETLTPDTPASFSYTPQFQDTPFLVAGDYAVVEQVSTDLDVIEQQLLKDAAQTPVEPPVSRPKPEMVQVTDLSLLAPREVVRRKISAWKFDIVHHSNMLDLFNQKLEDDRNVAMAMRLGIITTDRCAKHEKTVRMLKGMDLTA